MATILGGQTQNTWEVLPSVSRVLNFAVTVRDNLAGGGQTATDEVKVTVSNLGWTFCYNFSKYCSNLRSGIYSNHYLECCNDRSSSS
jgi:hypothetical protein